MSHKDEILELLDDIKPKALCDDCVSVELRIEPRQSVNLTCRALNAEKFITRIKTECDRCGKAKITNGFVAGFLPKVVAKAAAGMTGGKAQISGDSLPLVDVEKARTEIVRMCRALWIGKKEGDPPRGLSALINQLRNENILPNHEANMMLTLCNLRNVHVYEGLELQAREMLIAGHAKEIVGEWWAKRPQSARQPG